MSRNNYMHQKTSYRDSLRVAASWWLTTKSSQKSKTNAEREQEHKKNVRTNETVETKEKRSKKRKGIARNKKREPIKCSKTKKSGEIQDGLREKI